MYSSNYNTLYLPISADVKYQEGDIFKLDERFFNIVSHQIKIFHGLQIEKIDYCFSVRLHFNYDDWNKRRNIPSFQKYNFSEKLCTSFE